MMNISEEIAKQKKKEISRRKKIQPFTSFQDEITPSQRNFRNSLKNSKSFPHLIAEIKKASPSEGIIRENFNHIEIAEIYEKHATAISVLTDEHFFQGKLEYMREVSQVTTIPILCKDFIIDEYQIYEACYYNADAILLIAALLTGKQINKYIAIAKKLSMDCIVEVHTKEELNNVLKTETTIIGINNRNLEDFSVSLDTTIHLSTEIKKYFKNKKEKPIIISESGIQTKEDLVRLKNYADAVLIGTTFMKSKIVESKIQELYG